jgi:HlyD family secretion protein
MTREIFRSAALNRMSSPEQLDQMLEVTTPKYWLALIGIGLLLLCGLAWGFFGKMTTKAMGHGVVERATPGDDLLVVAYVPATVAKTVQPGNEVEIALTSFRVEDVGFLRGRVLSISEYPATDAELMSTLQNEALAHALSAGEPVNEVRVEMERDPSTVSGYRWSTPRGAEFHITPGNLCSVGIVTREERPLRLLVPFAKGSLGIY